MRRRSRNAFQAKPKSFHGQATRGVQSHPGFHTACEMKIAQPYAMMKVESEIATDWTEPEIYKELNDYPVIIELDMQGLSFEPDFDALTWFKEAIEFFVQSSKDFDEFSESLEFMEEDVDIPETMVESLFYLSGQSQTTAIVRFNSWLERQPDPEAAFIKVKREGCPDELLAEVSCQFRYTEDVPSDRILAVHYVQPVFNHVFPHYDDPEWEEGGYEHITERIEGAGYDVVAKEHIYDDMEVLTEVETTRLREAPPGARIEYHGTSLKNLLSAAPELQNVLPRPPAPFAGGSEGPGDTTLLHAPAGRMAATNPATEADLISELRLLLIGLDGYLTGKPRDAKQQAIHKLPGDDAIVNWLDGSELYYLSDGGYSRIAVDGMSSLYLTSESTDKVRVAWLTPGAQEYIRGIESLLAEFVKRWGG